MADAKISELSSATALTGTEAYPIVQSSTTVKGTVDQTKTYVLTTPVAVVGNATSGAELRLPEDTDNGSNYIALKAPDSIASNVTYTLPGTVTNGYYLTTDGSGTLSWGAGASLATPLAVVGNATAGAEIRLPEDTDNGSNYVAIKAPDNLAATYTLTLPSDDGAADQYLKTDGSGGLSWATVSGASAPLTLASGTITASAPALTITQTWNNGAVTFNGMLVNVTNTASASGSNLIDLQVGGSSKFKYTVGIGIDIADRYIYLGNTEVVDYISNQLRLRDGASIVATVMGTGVTIQSGLSLQWLDSGSDPGGTKDLVINRAGAGVLRVNGASSAAGAVRLGAYTVSGLPSASTHAYTMAFVSDATATTARSTVAGGGSNKVMVMSDGTNWLIVA